MIEGFVSQFIGYILLALSLAGSILWGKKQRDEKLEERKGRKQAERKVKIHETVNKADDQIDQRMREAEGDNEARNERLSNPGNY